MKGAVISERIQLEQDRLISDIMARERTRLRNFIRRRVADPGEVEDILQEVFYELVAAYRLMQPIEQAGAWLFRVARNRITDLFRKRGTGSEQENMRLLEEMLPSPEAGPEAAYARTVLLEELEDALEELPPEQREVFLAHEIEGRSFREIAGETGTSVNTLLSRKHYAVKYLRRRLRALYDEFSEI